MGRGSCGMCHNLGNTIYCDYYDVFFMKCEAIKSCPDGLDDEDDDYEDYDNCDDEDDDNTYSN